MTRILVFSLALSLVSVAEAGRLAGPGSKVFTVQGFKNYSVKVKFHPDQPAVVSIDGDGDSPLAVAVFDPAGNRVAADGKSTDRFSVRWTPKSNEAHVIRVYNRGGVPVRFSLKTN